MARQRRQPEDLGSARYTKLKATRNVLDHYFTPIGRLSSSSSGSPSSIRQARSRPLNLPPITRQGKISRSLRGNVPTAVRSHRYTPSYAAVSSTSLPNMMLDNSIDLSPPLPQLPPTSSTLDPSSPRWTNPPVKHETGIGFNDSNISNPSETSCSVQPSPRLRLSTSNPTVFAPRPKYVFDS
jgi:hypothetical protein